MGLFDLFMIQIMSKKRKEELLLLQKTLVKNSPDRLMYSEKQLKALAHQSAKNSLRIAEDCAKILQTTVKPDVFFDRLQLLAWHTSNLALLEKYVRFSGASPTTVFSALTREKQDCIAEFLVRYFGKVLAKADSLKTAKGKLNQYQKFFDSLKPHFEEMSAENIDYVETKYRVYTSSLEK